MKRQKFSTVLLLLALLLGATLPTATPMLAQSTQFPSKESVKAVMTRVNDYWLANAPYPGDNRWERAAYMTGNLAAYQTVGDSRYLDAAVTWAQSNYWQLNGGCATQFADNHAAAQSYIDLVRLGTAGASLDCTMAAMQAGMTWAWLELDLGSVQTIQQVNLYPFVERAYRYYVEVKATPDAPYTTVVNRSANTTNSSVLTDAFAPVAARFVKLWVVGAYNYIGWLGDYPPVAWVSIKEMEVLDSANTNVALNQSVTCSSAPEPQNPCTSAVDGIRDNDDNRWAASLYSAFVEESPNWWWIDAMFMAMPTYAKLGKDLADPTYHEVMYVRYQDAKENRSLYDPAAGLWYRDANYLYPAVTTPNGAKVFWSRGNGWVFAALARTLRELTPSDPHYNDYLATFQTMAAALKAAQRPEGYWNSSLADPNHFPGPESSGTAFFTYGLAWGINRGYLDAATYGEPVARAWQWLVSAAVHPDGKVGYVQPVGEQPGPAAYEDTMEYGVGAFLLAGSEVYQLAGDIPVAQNLALNKPVVCSSVPEPENACAHVVNGNLIDRWSATPYPQWVEVDLGAIYVIDTVKVHPFENRAYQYRVEGKATAAGGYVTLVDRTANTQGGSILEDHLVGVATRYVRLQVTGASGYEGVWVSIRELELFGQATMSVNALLSVRLRNLAYDPRPVTNAPAGVFTIGANFKNKATTPINHLFFQVTTLTGNNLLLNADGGPGGVGAILSVPGELAPQATAAATFQIGLQRHLPFLFLVKAYGVLPAGVAPAEAEAAAVDLDLSITSTALDEATTATFNNQSYLPLIMR